MVTLVPLPNAEVKKLVDHWYFLLDMHANVGDVLPLLSHVDLEMQLPEATLRGYQEFISWYERVTRTFFDEIHIIQRCEITPSPDRSWAEVDIGVKWLAKRWRPPESKSEWLAFDASQRWVVIRSPHTQKPVIQTYTVNSLIPLEGSAEL